MYQSKHLAKVCLRPMLLQNLAGSLVVCLRDNSNGIEKRGIVVLSVDF